MNKTDDIDIMRATFSTLVVELNALADRLAAAGEPPGAPADPRAPQIDQNTFTVAYGGKVCDLGGGLSFALFRRLARRPGQYVSREQLVEDVWGRGCRIADSTVRGAVCRLRRQLRAAGMAALAIALDGTAREHYALLPLWNVRKCNRNATPVQRPGNSGRR